MSLWLTTGHCEGGGSEGEAQTRRRKKPPKAEGVRKPSKKEARSDPESVPRQCTGHPKPHQLLVSLWCTNLRVSRATSNIPEPRKVRWLSLLSHKSRCRT